MADAFSVCKISYLCNPGEAGNFQKFRRLVQFGELRGCGSTTKGFQGGLVRGVALEAFEKHIQKKRWGWKVDWKVFMVIYSYIDVLIIEVLFI